LHKRCDIIREKLAGIDAFGFVAFTRPAEVDGDAGKMLGVLGYLEGITGVIGGQIGNEDQRFSISLLVN